MNMYTMCLQPAEYSIQNSNQKRFNHIRSSPSIEELLNLSTIPLYLLIELSIIRNRMLMAEKWAIALTHRAMIRFQSLPKQMTFGMKSMSATKLNIEAILINAIPAIHAERPLRYCKAIDIFMRSMCLIRLMAPKRAIVFWQNATLLICHLAESPHTLRMEDMSTRRTCVLIRVFRHKVLANATHGPFRCIRRRLSICIFNGSGSMRCTTCALASSRS